MTPADRRITELIEKWQTSIDLHLQYAELSDAAYARAQAWPKHDRPTRWVLEVARQKIVELKSQCETRQAMGDGQFAESLELMAFLANLVGIQHIQRFIPLADATREDKNSAATTESQTVIRPGPGRPPSVSDDATREMPKLKTAQANPPAAMPVARRESPRTAVPAAALKRPAAPQPSKPVKQAAPAPSPAAPAETDVKGKIIADAVRLLKWGKPWHELAELIGRIADRPPVAEIRKVLRTHKTEIDSKSGKSA